jgi:flagellar biosynthetic protein FliQ
LGQGDFISIGQQAIYTALLISAPVLGLGLIVGILVSVFQAATQINEQTMTFIPKILAVVIAFILFGPWMLSTMVEFTTELFANINGMIQ